MAEAEDIGHPRPKAITTELHHLHLDEFQIVPSNIDLESLIEAESCSTEKVIVAAGSYTIKSSLHQNEDRCSESTQDNFHVFVVADGHDGDNASVFACDNLGWNVLRAVETADRMFAEMACKYTIDNALRQAILFTDAQFCQVARRTGSTSGACVAAVAVRGRHAAFASSGDCGLLYHDQDGNYRLVCKRHTAKDESEAERIRSVGGYIQGDRVLGVLAPSRGIGDTDVRDQCPGCIIPDPDICSVIISSSETDITCPKFCILASDGVFDTIDIATAVSLVKKTLVLHANQSKRAELAARKLVQYCAARTTDDITAIVICFR